MDFYSIGLVYICITVLVFHLEYNLDKNGFKVEPTGKPTYMVACIIIGLFWPYRVAYLMLAKAYRWLQT